MFTAITILAIAAAITTFVISAAFNSCGLWESHMFHLHPSASELAAVTAIFHVLPFLALISVWLSANTHLMKCMACIGWTISLFLLEEMVQPSVELLPSGVFVAVIALSVFHMFAFLRIHVLLYYAMFFAGKIIGYPLRLLQLAFRPSVCVIISPLIMHMLIEDVVNPFIHIACQYNIHSFGLFVVGVSSGCHVLKKMLWLARRFYGWIVISTFFITAAHHPVLWNLVTMIGFLAISAATVLAIVAALEILAIAVKTVLAWLLRMGQEQMHVLRPHQPLVEMHPVPHRLSITWSDGLQVSFVEIDPTRHQAFTELNRRVDGNYQLESRAQSALEELNLFYNELKQQYPRRFRQWSKFEQLYEDCVHFEQGIDILFLELKLRAEFDANDAIQCVSNTLEEAEEDSAFENDHDEAAEEANVPAEVEAADVHMPLHQEDALLPIDNDEFEANFDNHDGGVEEDVEEVVAPPPVRRRRRRRRDDLATELGEYWKPPTGRRRSSRVRREPQWYQP